MASGYVKRPDDLVLVQAPEGFTTEDGSDPTVRLPFEDFVRAMLGHKKFQTPTGLAYAEAIEVGLETSKSTGWLAAPRNALQLLAACVKEPDFLIDNGEGRPVYARIYPFAPTINRKIRPFIDAAQKVIVERPANLPGASAPATPDQQPGESA